MAGVGRRGCKLPGAERDLIPGEMNVSADPYT